jgi:ABC-type Na+ efflux pump permease subunit
LSAIAATLLGISMRRIRRVVLGGLSGGTEGFRLVERPAESPVAWKDNTGPVWYLKRADKTAVTVALTVSCLIAAASELGLRDEAVHLFYLERAFWMVAILRLAILAADSVTREKESGAWAVLLTTPLDDTQIVHAKALTALRRDAMLLLSALAIQLAWLIGAPDASEITSTLLFMLSRVASVFLVLAVGLYYGVHLKATVAAAGAAVGTCLCLIYLVGGRLLPLLVRLPWFPHRLAASPDLVIPASVIVLSLSLGALLFERTRRDLRQCIF